MTLFRWLAIGVVPILILVQCTDDDESDGGPKGGAESVGGEGGREGEAGNGGTAGTNRGGSSNGGDGGASAGAGGDSGEAGTGGAPAGGSPATGGTSGGGSSAGGRSGMGGSAGMEGGEAGGGGETCATESFPLRSANFDSDTAAWVQYDAETGAVRPIIVTAASAGITTDSEPNVAHFGGVDDAQAGMSQALAIPDGAVSMTLTGRRRITTQEAGSTPLDVLTIQLWEDAQTTTGLVGDFAVLSNAEATGDWVEFTGTISVDGREGEMLDLDLWAETDSSLITDFYVDSLVLTAYVCR